MLSCSYETLLIPMYLAVKVFTMFGFSTQVQFSSLQFYVSSAFNKWTSALQICTFFCLYFHAVLFCWFWFLPSVVNEPTNLLFVVFFRHIYCIFCCCVVVCSSTMCCSITHFIPIYISSKLNSNKSHLLCSSEIFFECRTEIQNHVTQSVVFSMAIYCIPSTLHISFTFVSL